MPNIQLEPPFAGRGPEIDQFNRILSGAVRGKGSLVLLAGEAGVGKSRLCEQIAGLATAAKFHVTTGRCIPGAPVPYLPFQDAFEHYFQQESRAGNISKRFKKPQETGLWMWLKGPEQRKFDLEPDTERERTFHATLDLMAKLSNERPLLIVLDDLQWADTASIQLLHFLGRNSGGLNLVIVGTYRPEDLSVPGEGTVHPLLETLRVMRRERLGYELHLGPLTVDELEIALQGMLGGKIDSDSLKRVFAESGGNPLFAVETVRWLAEIGKIRQEDKTWTIMGPGELDMPTTIREVIWRRIERLPEDQRHILEYASIVGEQFDPTIIEDGLNLPRLDLLEKLDQIQRDSHLVIADDMMYRFCHEKIRRVLDDSLSALRRRELHRIVAQALERRLPDKNLYGQLSYHLYQTGDLEKCGKYSLLAGQISLKSGGITEGQLYFERTLETLKNESSRQERLQAEEGLADCNKTIGRFEKAFSNYQEYLKLAQDTGDRARVLRKSAEVAPSSQAAQLMDEAESSDSIEPVEKGRIKRLRGHLAFSAGALDRAARFYDEAQEIFDLLGASEDYAYSLLDHTALHLAQGEVLQAVDTARQAEKIFSEIRSPGGYVAVNKQIGDILLNQGRYEEALQRYGHVIELGAKYGRYPYLSFARVYRTAIFVIRHDLEAALSEGQILQEYAKMARFPYDRITPALLLAFVLVKLNRVGEGERLYSEASKVLDSLKLEKRTGLLAGPDIRFYSMPINLAVQKAVSAELFARKGEFARSNQDYRECISLWQGAANAFAFQATGRIFYAESLQKQGLKEEASEQLLMALEAYRRLGDKNGQQIVTSLLEKGSLTEAQHL